MAAFLLAPLAAGPIVGPLFSLYLRLSVDSEQFRVDKFLQGALSFGFAVTIVAYLATLLGGAMTLWYAHKNRIVPSFWFTVVTGLVGGTVVVESNPWVWFLQGDVGSQLFFLYAGLGALSGAIVAALFWVIALRSKTEIRVA